VRHELMRPGSLRELLGWCVPTSGLPRQWLGSGVSGFCWWRATRKG